MIWQLEIIACTTCETIPDDTIATIIDTPAEVAEAAVDNTVVEISEPIIAEIISNTNKPPFFEAPLFNMEV